MKSAAILLIIVALVAHSSLGCPGNEPTHEDPPVCGNSQIETGEVCDGTALRSTCEQLGYGAGTIACKLTCKDYDRSRCGASVTCGNGTVDPPEICDGADLDGATCTSLGLGTGVLGCLTNCGDFDTSACGQPPSCGNNNKEGAEICDGTDVVGLTCTSLGLDPGVITCAADCLSYDVSGCGLACVPDCSNRECGPDPVCGISCGTCTQGTCSAVGMCESAPDPLDPIILSYTSNVTAITEGETVTFTAVVTDPQGIDDVIGGTLSNGQGATFGAFVTAAQEGAYTLDLSWNQVDQVQEIQFELEESRQFEATFFDVAGHSSTATISILFECGGGSACAGHCFDTMTNPDHCGGCDQPVPAEAICSNGVAACADSADTLCGSTCSNLASSTQNCGSCGHACPPWAGIGPTCAGGICSVFDSFYVRDSCANLCADSGYVCTDSIWIFYGTSGFQSIPDAPCADTPPETHPANPSADFSAVNCSCEHTAGGGVCNMGPEDSVAACTDGCSNDGDAWIDCEDFDCCSVVTCPQGTACNP